MIYQAEKLQEDHESAKFDAELSGAKDALDSDDLSVIQSAFSVLEAAVHAAASCAYQQQTSPGAEESTDADINVDDDIVDAEYEEVDPA